MVALFFERLVMIKGSKLYRKVRPFCDNRLYPVLLMWGCSLLACKTMVWAMGYLTEGEQHPQLNLVNLSTFGDGRAILLLALSVLMVMAVSFVIKTNVNASSINQASVDWWTRRLWDEVSSAATHAGAALFVSLYWPFVAQLPPREASARMTVAVGLALLGFICFDISDADAVPAKKGGSD